VTLGETGGRGRGIPPGSTSSRIIAEIGRAKTDSHH
jgi:hypothetical protein